MAGPVLPRGLPGLAGRSRPGRRLLQELSHQLDDGRVYDRDLLALAGALTAVVEAYRRRPYVRDRAAAGQPDDLLG